MGVLYSADPTSDTLRKSSGFKRPSSAQENISTTTTTATISVETDSTVTIGQACTRKEQTSLPLWVLEKIIEKDHLSVQTSPATMSSAGKIHLNGGGMVGNCNSMLDFKWSVGEGTGKHYFQAKVRKPLRCETIDGMEVCDYEVQTATNSIADDTKKIAQYEPNYYGFLKCLEDTGAMDSNGEFQFDKVAETKFELTQSGVNSTGDIEYYCHGPECSKDAGGNIIGRSGNSCQNFQEITPGGASILSREDKTFKDINTKFQKICSSGDYNIIDASLPDFTGFSDLYSLLVKVRDGLLEEKIKALKKELMAESYEDLNANEYNTTIKDFYNMIILPLSDKIATQHKIVKGLSGKEKEKAQIKLDALVKKLVDYAKTDFFSVADYDKMLSFSKKAPLHKEEWREAALNSYRGNSLAFHLARFNKVIGKDLQKKEKAASREYPLNISVKSALAKIKKDVNEQKEKLDKLGVLANDSSGKISFAKEELVKAKKIEQRHQYKIASLGNEMRQEQKTQRECFMGVSSMMPYLAQKCAQKSYARMSEIQNDINYYSQPDYRKYVINPQIQNQMNLANQWVGIERDRNLSYGVTSNYSLNEFVDPRVSNTYLPPSIPFQGNQNWMFMQQQQQQQQWPQQNQFNMYRQPSGFPGYQGNQNGINMQPQQQWLQQQYQFNNFRQW